MSSLCSLRGPERNGTGEALSRLGQAGVARERVSLSVEGWQPLVAIPCLVLPPNAVGVLLR